MKTAKQIYFLLLLTLLGIGVIKAASEADASKQPTCSLTSQVLVNKQTTSKQPTNNQTTNNQQTARGTTMWTGAFSDIECGSAWCNRHEGKKGQIALNYRKYGKVKQVRIEGVTYTVVGSTYNDKDPLNSLDAEIWYGQDQQGAINFGVKQLLVELIK